MQQICVGVLLSLVPILFFGVANANGVSPYGQREDQEHYLSQNTISRSMRGTLSDQVQQQQQRAERVAARELIFGSQSSSSLPQSGDIIIIPGSARFGSLFGPIFQWVYNFVFVFDGGHRTPNVFVHGPPTNHFPSTGNSNGGGEGEKGKGGERRRYRRY